MTTISEQAFRVILAKPGQEWTDEENAAFWAYMKTVQDQALHRDYIRQAVDARRAYLREHPETMQSRPFEEWSAAERASFEVGLLIENEQDGYVFDGERWARCSDARPMAEYCWSRGCGHLADEHDAGQPNAACAVVGCSCAVLVRPSRLGLPCVCGHELWRHLDLDARIDPGTACQFIAATPVAST